MQRKGLRGMKRRGGSPSGLDCEDPAQPIAEKGEEVGWQVVIRQVDT